MSCSRGNLFFMYLEINHSFSRRHIWIWKKQFSRVPPRDLKWDNKQTHRRQPAENLCIFSSKVPFECWLGVCFRENDKETIKLSIFEGEKKGHRSWIWTLAPVFSWLDWCAKRLAMRHARTRLIDEANIRASDYHWPIILFPFSLSLRIIMKISK